MKSQKGLGSVVVRRLLSIVWTGAALIGLVTTSHAVTLPSCERLPTGAYIGDQALLWSSNSKEALPVLREVDAEFHGPSRVYIVLRQEAAPGKTHLLTRDDQKRVVNMQVLSKNNGEFLPICEVEIMLPPPGLGGSLFLVDTKNPTQLWRVKVTYLGTEEVSDTKIVLNAFSDHKSAQELRTNPICRTIPPKYLKPSLTSVQTSRDVMFTYDVAPPTIFYVNSTNEIILKVDRVLAAKTAIRGQVRMLVKVNESDASYAPACEVDFELTPSTQSVAIGGWAADSRFLTVPVTWRIELIAAPQSATAKLRLSTLRIIRNFGNTVTLPPNRTFISAASEMICHDSTNIEWGGEIAPTPFANRPTLETLISDPDKMLTPGARSTIHKAILHSMELWRRVCRDCTAWNLVAARIDEDVYVLEPIATFLTDYLGPERSNRQADDPMGRLISPKQYYDGLSIWLNARSSGRGDMPVLTFQKLVTGSRALNTLCQTSDVDHYEKLRELRAGLCGIKTVESVSSKILLKLLILNGHTSCGFSKDIVACEADPVLMELNAGDYRFIDYLSGEIVFGRGDREIALLPVIIHEIGHWLGLPHIQEQDAIMSASAEEARCITHFDATALLKAFENPRGPAPRQLDAFFYRSVSKKALPSTVKK
ncbi:Matrixin [Nitrosospira sp. Nsp18]|uniref:matrixin family metalloprotease n=1 Tax=Nitrosospira sp. Nsp18 TaxID=1855334 RepID=UPI000889C3A7|nr:matrixin family metalloprotease [Nitrosospira sp. Nsp18]SDA28835.1 Matrixin [Nitrosospira sp. Nsp18]